MFTATLTTLAAVAALNAQVVTASTPSAANAVSAPAATTVSAPAVSAPAVSAPAVSAPAVTAISVRSQSAAPRGVRIPGTFTVVADQNPLEGLEALYVVRSGDGG